MISKIYSSNHFLPSFSQGNVKGIVEINLSKYPDFTIETHPPIGKSKKNILLEFFIHFNQ